jgi:RNA polymerase sigma-70 factor, ECF subfamily
VRGRAAKVPVGCVKYYRLSYASVMDELTHLARAAGRGDNAALAALIQRTQSDVWRLCAHLVDPAAADDLAQDTYLRAIGALKGFRGDAPVRAWLLTIARRVCAAEVSARLRGRQLAARLAAMPQAGLGQAPEAEGRAAVAQLLGALEPDRRAAFVLTQMIGCSYAEAAAVCDCPVGTIRSRVARAREDLIAMTAERAKPQAADGAGPRERDEHAPLTRAPRLLRVSDGSRRAVHGRREATVP